MKKRLAKASLSKFILLHSTAPTPFSARKRGGEKQGFSRRLHSATKKQRTAGNGLDLFDMRRVHK